MNSFYGYEKEDPIVNIEYVKGMYDEQVHKIKQEEYIKDLLFADYVRAVKRNRSKYNCIESIFMEAQSQVDKKKKKEREQLEIIESFLKEDFLNNDPNFKIVEIISGGYENYYWDVVFDGFGETISITIPNLDKINISNITYARDGKFSFSIKESEYAWSIKKMSYKIKDISEYIKEYFSLGSLNEDDY